MDSSNPQARELMACLGDASRWRLVDVLRAGRRCVTELAEGVQLSQSCTTRHLQVLRREGIVERKRKGKRVLFRLRTEDPAIASLLAWADGQTGEAPLPRAAGSPPATTRTSPSKRGKKQGLPAKSAPEAPVPPKPPAAPVRRPRPGDLEDYLL